MPHAFMPPCPIHTPQSPAPAPAPASCHKEKVSEEGYQGGREENKEATRAGVIGVGKQTEDAKYAAWLPLWKVPFHARSSCIKIFKINN